MELKKPAWTSCVSLVRFYENFPFSIYLPSCWQQVSVCTTGGIIPRNKAELNQCAHRVLNQMAENFLKKDENISVAFNVPNETRDVDTFDQRVLTH